MGGVIGSIPCYIGDVLEVFKRSDVENWKLITGYIEDDKELKKHTDKFQREMAKIDNKSAYLREVFKRINLAGREEERKLAMELMSDLSGYSLSEQEFAEFMKGKKQIEL